MKKRTKTVMAGLLIFSSAVCAAQTAEVTPDIEVEINTPYTITSAVDATGATASRWLENGAVIDGEDGAAYTNPAGKPDNSTFIYIRQSWVNNCWQNSNAIIVQIGTGGSIGSDTGNSGGGCDAPGTTVDFTAFNPCDVAVGSTWTLVDSRESNNIQEYKVKKMPDNRIWMVQDMKFGNKCDKTSFTGSTSDQTTSNLTTIYGYPYGDCRNASASDTPSNRGYLYDWAAAMQKAKAYNGSDSDVGCYGTDTLCKGICPSGWHIPTGRPDGDYALLYEGLKLFYTCDANDCFNDLSPFEGAPTVPCTPGCTTADCCEFEYLTSTLFEKYPLDVIYALRSPVPSSWAGESATNKIVATAVRCVRNK
jgi:uncharacterized protein (TIGR02145 family)